MNWTARRQQARWTQVVRAYAQRLGLREHDLDSHAARFHYAAGDNIALVVAEAAGCLHASGGEVDGCV